MNKPHAVLLYPALQCVKRTVDVWSMDYVNHFPLALFRISTFLKNKGYSVTYLDAFSASKMNVSSDLSASGSHQTTPDRFIRNAPVGRISEGITEPVYQIGLSRDELAERLRRLPPVDEFWISSIYTWTWPTTWEAVELCKEIHPHARVLLGGIYPSLMPEHAESSGADVVHRGIMPEVENLWCDREMIRSMNLRNMVLKTSTGCPNACTYCAVSMLEGRKLIFRDPTSVITEIQLLSKEFGILDYVIWESSLLMKPEEHFIPIMEGIIKIGEPFRIRAPEGVQCNLISKKVAELMFKGGFDRVNLTVETTSEKMLAHTRRPYTGEHLVIAANNLVEAGYRTEDIKCTLLIGQPGQTRTSILRDILAVYSLGCAAVLLTYTMIPGTVDFQRAAGLPDGRSIQDLDPLLFPFVSDVLTARDIERLLMYFNQHHIPLDRIATSVTEDDLICEMQDLLARGDYLHA